MRAAGGQAGTAVVVVGPSGAGKDSVMGYAARHFSGDARFVFARRVITRPSDAGGEAHVGVDAATFARMQDEGGFCVSWEAHGLSYGVPVEMKALVGEGRVVVVNGSRQALSVFAAVFPRLKVVTVTASAEVLAQRLRGRGRESGADIAGRLERRPGDCAAGLDHVIIDNSGPLDVAGQSFVGILVQSLEG
ncbi:phosphonate metabolism protein/1,5-bisphosphokinase (PRPP-forming) PhnN [Rhizobium sp. GN54]|uniref:phosphonate metabolism protein/1,5-bisphosphokinase (PRPP-forming) PhnN n=1 Tax=Rhizobium sp. GN54 TaxID=2898150 RepID=UPI001E294F50|nr:phosphonate metabolism protein/1,5-bisphosphokinase (PRPP-forming) PhnN [Rhizobium sp. GN54]MCD2183341.1 phosphonate metabolism protein/1,5-bisphosphokinase (PRPP-forming) PhnN [Rhizobium sp. GN54]